jgi:hypothetical protein
VGREADAAVGGVLEVVVGLVPVLPVPLAEIHADLGVQMEVAAHAVHGQAGGHRERAIGGERHVESPHDALPVEPRLVQPVLAPVVALLGLQVIHAEQHAEVVLKGEVRIDGKPGFGPSAAGAPAIRSVEDGVHGLS